MNMLLKSGLKVFSNLETISEQLFINGGTKPAPSESQSGLKYNEGSYVPMQNWREMSKNELKILLENKNTKNVHFSKGIYVGDIPSNLKRCLNSLNLASCNKVDQVYPTFADNELIVKKITIEISNFLQTLSSNKNYKFHRITRAMPTRETVTSLYINDEFIFIGLHIDQSTHFKIHTAHKSGNRISISLSNEPRTLAFINLSMIQVFNMLKHKVDPTNLEINPDNIASLFFKYYPDYPTIKLIQKPYQYYVAPTDNFFHDASTYGNKEIDITIVYTGMFDINNIK